MKHKKFLLIIALFSCCLSVNAASASIFRTAELCVRFDCVRVGEYLVPKKTLQSYSGARRERYDYQNDTLIVEMSDDCQSDTMSMVEYKKGIKNFCKRNAIDEIINFYQSWQSDPKRSAFLKDLLFPDCILDTSPHSLLIEENNATKLAILLSAVSGNIEGRILALEIISGDDVEMELNQCRSSLQRDLETAKAKQSLGDLTILGLKTLSSLSLSEQSIQEVMKQADTKKNHIDINARTLLRIADRYLLTKNQKKSKEYFQLAAEKGSIRALLMLTHLIANSEAKEPDSRWQAIDLLLSEYSHRLGGYQDLLKAYYYQFGALDLVKRDLTKANQCFKESIKKDCREAAFEYGEFLISMMNSNCDEKAKCEFRKHAIDAYEKAGDLGQTLGYSKALELIAQNNCSKDVAGNTQDDSSAPKLSIGEKIQAKLDKSQLFFGFLNQPIESKVTSDGSSSELDHNDRRQFMNNILKKFFQHK